MIKLKTIAILTICALLLQNFVFAFETNSNDEFAQMTGLSDCYTAAFANREELPLDASAVVLVERETGEVLYEKNADEPRAIASITKVMTIILVMEALESGKISLDETVNISEHAFSMGGSQIWLEPGEIFTVNELLKAVSVASANDAAVALAEHVGGSEDGFVSMMNQKAAELGMTKTTFKNSNGLDEDGHISCARDVALMSREILKHELVRNYITTWMDELRNGETQLTNTNKMLKSFNGISGIKTGTTNKAGVCISASAIRNDMELIAVVLGSSDSKARFASAGTLLEYGFANYELAPIKLDMALLTPVEVSLGEEEKCGIVYDIPKNVVVEKGKSESVMCEIEMNQKVNAPVEQGQVLGKITVYCDGIAIGNYPVTAENAIAKLQFQSGIARLLKAAFTM
ncbi:MAG: D-alanyl-D-alanine carboxypeptidase family protein [Oscillospiraceae bacterium]